VGTAAVVVACATPGRRRAAPNARLSLRLAEGALEGPAERLERAAADLVAARDRLVDRLAAATGRPPDELVAAAERGPLLSAEEAVAAGLVDEVATRRP
jgi:ATP-dependent Clp protease protease subunit